MKHKHRIASLLLTGFSLGFQVHAQEHPGNAAGKPSPISHAIAAGKQGRFYAWPANNGVWTWQDGKEILVGFCDGEFIVKKSHNIVGNPDSPVGIDSLLTRSLDGGKTWAVETPANFVGKVMDLKESPGQIRFDHPDFAMRVVGRGYHGSDDPAGSFFFSLDRGKTWQGPFHFGDLMKDPALSGMEFTGRTAYLINSADSCLLFLSARAKKNGSGRDKACVAETTDGGKTFRFVSWIVPLGDPHRAVMPAPARLSDGSIAVSLRRRDPKAPGTASCWVDCYGSKDNGRTWTFLSRVGETGAKNGNPPGMTLLKDGRLACAYGDRNRGKMYARLSADGGKTWGDEFVIRDDFKDDQFKDGDFGYPRLVQNHRGELVATYYWASSENPHQHIAATLWAPEELKQK
jgi:photosystem II stability/assembly factor-like uncharacterized protein